MNNAPLQGPDPKEVRSRLIHWYDDHRRDLPWRRTRDPYAVLVSEVMLQQTRMDTVLPYYLRFLRRFPSAFHLAAAPEEEVLRLWQGLGYYRRARQLHRAARVLVERHGGRVPPDVDAVRALPGVGDYTAGAVLSIAFDLPVPAVDGNAQRVLSRIFGVDEPADRAAGRRRLDELARRLVDGPRPGALNQAVMELGSTVCTPRKPNCAGCPVADLCVAGRSGRPEGWPVRHRSTRWVEEDVVMVWCARDGQLALVRRPEDGLLGGLWALPYARREEGETWLEARARLAAVLEAALGEPLRWQPESLQGRWDFSHRRWHWRLFLAIARDRHGAGDGDEYRTAGGAGGGAGRGMGDGMEHGAGYGAEPGDGIGAGGSAGGTSPVGGAVAEDRAAWGTGTVHWVEFDGLEGLAMASLDRRVLAAVARAIRAPAGRDRARPDHAGDAAG